MTSGPVFLTGATGLIGGRLCDELLAAGREVRALSRRAEGRPDRDGLTWVEGDPARPGDWAAAIDGAEAVVHLAGEPVASRRWSQEQKRRLRSSRIDSTRTIVDAMGRAASKPRRLVCASATGYYGPRGDERLDETSAPGSDFLSEICRDWEQEARAAEAHGASVVSLRFGVVLSRRGGALARMWLPFKLGLGGPLGPVDRWFPWVHEADALGLLRLALESELRGAVNCVAPEAVRMGEFARALGRTLGRPALLPVPLALLRLALGEMGEALVPGQRVVPSVALDASYAFRYPQLVPALEALATNPSGA